MQFTGKAGIAVFVLLVSGAVAIVFGSGCLVGRQFPAHHFERMGESWYVLDTTTGKVCSPFRDPNADPFAKYAVDTTTGKPVGPTDANGFPLVQSASSYPPACGK